METSLQKQSQLAVARVNQTIAQMNPVLIAIIFDQVVPILIGCLRNWLTKPTPAQMQEAVRAEHMSNPEKLLRKTARRIRGESDAPMTKEQSRELARAVIAQMVEADAEQISVACTEAMATEAAMAAQAEAD